MPIGAGRDVAYGGRGTQQIRDTKGRFAGALGVEWQGLEAVAAGTLAYETEVRARVLGNAERLKDEMVQYMQATAPWEDRTGDARQQLQGDVISERDSVTILLGHGADIFYGYFLENYTYSGVSYAVIMPTISHYASEIMSKVVG